jgi:Putative addiction module component
MSTKAILEAAMKLPPRSRARLAGKLLDSLDEPVWDEVIISGAKVAEERLRRLRAGETRGVPEVKAHCRLFGKKS